jgi:hypothetical protein
MGVVKDDDRAIFVDYYFFPQPDYGGRRSFIFQGDGASRRNRRPIFRTARRI